MQDLRTAKQIISEWEEREPSEKEPICEYCDSKAEYFIEGTYYCHRCMDDTYAI